EVGGLAGRNALEGSHLDQARRSQGCGRSEVEKGVESGRCAGLVAQRNHLHRGDVQDPGETDLRQGCEVEGSEKALQLESRGRYPSRDRPERRRHYRRDRVRSTYSRGRCVERRFDQVESNASGEYEKPRPLFGRGFFLPGRTSILIYLDRDDRRAAATSARASPAALRVSRIRAARTILAAPLPAEVADVSSAPQGGSPAISVRVRVTDQHRRR